MADILPENIQLPNVYELDYVKQVFTPSLSDGEKLISIKITKWERNDGITVEDNMYSGHYTNIFDYGTERLLYRKGDEFSYLPSWDSITEPSKTDIYLWKAPTTPRIYKYTVEMEYMESSSGEGSSRSASGGTIVKEYTQMVFPNWDAYARKLKEQIRIRRLTWQD